MPRTPIEALQRFSALWKHIAANIPSSMPATSAMPITLLLESCALDDMAGNLITAGNRSIPRKSVAEFSWVVGLPELTTTDSYFHVKYASERSAEARAAESEEERRKAHLGQAIFSMPFIPVPIRHKDNRRGSQDDRYGRGILERLGDGSGKGEASRYDCQDRGSGE